MSPGSTAEQAEDSESYRTQYYNSTSIPRQLYESMKLQARHIFLNDIVVLTPTSNAISHGHFANLARLLRSPTSKALEAAINAVALAMLGNRFRESKARKSAAAEYMQSVRTLSTQDLASDIRCSIACISLLSIYEILNAEKTDSFRCMLHLRGIMALMRTEESFQCQPASGIALLVLGTAAYDQAAGDAVNSFPSAADNNVNTMTVNRLRAVPAAESSLDELVSILPRLSNLFKRAGELVQPSSFHFEAHITSIKEEALALRAELLAWEVKQQRASRVTTIEWFTQAYTLRFPGAKDLVCPTFRADSYDDHIIANMWNTYRQCQLHLCNLICRLNEPLATNDKESRPRRESDRLRHEIENYITDIYSTIPFMLAGNVICYCRPDGLSWSLPKPATLLGGLSMQWRLFTIAMLESASNDSKQHARNVLSWIGETLGIGQATVLAQINTNPRGGITAKGDVLSWTGFLV